MANDRQSDEDIYETASERGDDAYETALERAHVPLSSQQRVRSRFDQTPPYASPEPQLVIDSFLQPADRDDRVRPARSTAPAEPASADSQGPGSETTRQRLIHDGLPVERFSDDVLMSDGAPTGRPDEMIFLSRQQFAEKYGHAPTPEEMDERSLLLRDKEGNYRTREEIYRSIKIGKSVPRDQRQARRDKIFAEQMAKYGVSTQRFGKALNWNNYLDTPAGSRWQYKKFVHPLQSGQDNPDILIRSADGSYLGIYPKLRPDFHPLSIDQIGAERGDRYVWLKGEDRTYYNLNNLSGGSAGSLYEKYLQTNNPHQLPNLLVRRDRVAYAAGDTYDLALKTARETGGRPNNPYEGGVLMRGRNGKSLVKPSTLEWMGQENYRDEHYSRRANEALAVPAEMQSDPEERVPSVLVADPKNPRIYLDGEMFRLITGHRIASQPDTAILIQNHDQRGGTGNFATLAFVLDPGNDKSLTTGQKTLIGRDVPSYEWNPDDGFGTDTSSADEQRHPPHAQLGGKRKREASVSEQGESSADETRAPPSKRFRLDSSARLAALPVRTALKSAYLKFGGEYFATRSVVEKFPRNPQTRAMIRGDRSCDLLFKASDGHTVLPGNVLVQETGEAGRARIRRAGLSSIFADQLSDAPLGPPALVNSGDGRLIPYDSATVGRNLKGRSVIETFGPDRSMIRMENGGYRTYAATLHLGDPVSIEAASAIGVEPRERVRQVGPEQDDTSESEGLISWSESDYGGREERGATDPAEPGRTDRSRSRQSSIGI
ncbi:hypothetical protein [Notoacmeibacter sp. MSK16QG-6]|uniref:hypothetical protein n=1 Tax=Notoacmeibacter sp. MSK16QG-6 TaxID=2957982 RepID=UPI0020A1F40F|nr:hypothetical protein [Notoacmeibacter sp. MSK16QG-6]MCP1200610.1 hypothetical protein [Notoacmeibacter sp. MSK16QG-6]